jgi:transcriptional regulator with XRE-family HTH domain
MKDPEIRRSFEEELLYGEVSDNFAALLESIGLNKKELARRLGVSQGRVSQILSGEENLTLRTVASLAWALGLRANVQLEPLRDRSGTPASDDLPAPSWLGHVHASKVQWRFASVSLPHRVERPQPKPLYLVAINGQLRSAA